MEAKDTRQDTVSDEATDGTPLSEPEDGGYPPDDFDVMDMEAPDAPGRPPVPRAAGIRARARQQAVARPTTRVKQAKKVKRGSGSKLLAQQKRRQALELRKAGASYLDIASALGYADQSGARKAVIKAFGEVIHEPVNELRSMQVERLNHMLMTLWPRVQQGDDSAIRTSLAVMDKMDRLMGTDQAPSIDVNVTNQTGILVIDGNKDDYIAQMRKMAGVDSNGHNVTAQQVPSAPGQPAQPALPAGPVHTGPAYPPGMSPGGHAPQGPEDDVVDAELVDDEQPESEHRDTLPAEPVRTGEPAHPTKKKFSFGVDPTVRRDKQ